MDAPITLDRRDLLKTTTGLLTGWAVAGSPLALLVRGRAWAVDLTTLTSSEGATLMAVARTIAPHDKLDDAAYALVIQAVDRDASREESSRRMIKDGTAGLGAGFTASTENDRVQSLKKIESTEFFQAMRLKTLQVLYSTTMAYAYFAYEGEAS